jgi:amino acid transporter
VHRWRAFTLPRRAAFIPVALIFSCIAVGVLYTFMSWAIVSAYGTNTDWSTVAASASSTHVFDGKTVPVDYDHFVLGPAGVLAGQFWASALSYLIITGSLACAAALTNAGLRYMYAMGREGLLPRYLGRTIRCTGRRTWPCSPGAPSQRCSS